MERNAIRNSLSKRLDVVDLKYDIRRLSAELYYHKSKTAIRMKNYLTKLVSNTIHTYMYNRLKTQCEIIADELKALEEKRAELPDQSNELKICFVCKKEKPKKEFGKWKKSKDGYDYRCKICKRKFTNNWSKNKKKLVGVAV